MVFAEKKFRWHKLIILKWWCTSSKQATCCIHQVRCACLEDTLPIQPVDCRHFLTGGPRTSLEILAALPSHLYAVLLQLFIVVCAGVWEVLECMIWGYWWERMGWGSLVGVGPIYTVTRKSSSMVNGWIHSSCGCFRVVHTPVRYLSTMCCVKAQYTSLLSQRNFGGIVFWLVIRTS